MRNFRNWEVHHNSKKLIIEIYNITNTFPDSEKFGLTSQIRRSAVSIPANIAEGAGRRTDNDFKHFLSMALGSSFEVEALLDIALDLKLISNIESENLMSELQIVQKQLNAFITKLKNDANN